MRDHMVCINSTPLYGDERVYARKFIKAHGHDYVDVYRYSLEFNSSVIGKNSDVFKLYITQHCIAIDRSDSMSQFQ